MTFEEFCQMCRSLPHATEDVKWGNDLVFSVAGKMFASIATGEEEFQPFGFKCSPERYEELIEREGIIPAPYMARAQWVMIQSPSAIGLAEGRGGIEESYRLVLARLPKRVQAELAAEPDP